MVAAMCVVMSSCLKNDDSSYVAPVDPAAQDSLLRDFMDAHPDFNMITQSDSLYYYVVNNQSIKLTGVLAPYLYYEIVDPGDMTNDSTVLTDDEIGGKKGGNVTVFNTLSDSTLIVSASYTGTLLDGTVFDKTDDKNVLFFIHQTIYAWQFLMNKVGRGGHIRILAPSIYGYSNSAQQGIPVNSPLYFDVKVAGFIKNEYANN